MSQYRLAAMLALPMEILITIYEQNLRKDHSASIATSSSIADVDESANLVYITSIIFSIYFCRFRTPTDSAVLECLGICDSKEVLCHRTV